uniref:Transmembrane BAX inhibitor motif containing 6 n=1 Tax=Sus scrofa TaxID=9823 RepID=A0A4X1WCJ7_PIG
MKLSKKDWDFLLDLLSLQDCRHPTLLMVVDKGPLQELVVIPYPGAFCFLGVGLALLWTCALPLTPGNSVSSVFFLPLGIYLRNLGDVPVALDIMVFSFNSILPTAFMGTAMIFTCFTLSALYARRRSYLFLGGILMSAMSLMVLSSLGNLFFGSIWLFQANLYVGLVVMCGFVLFDTQLIIEKAENGDKDYIWHCVDLFLDFVTLFRKLMMILAMNEKDKKKEKK